MQSTRGRRARRVRASTYLPVVYLTCAVDLSVTKLVSCPVFSPLSESLSSTCQIVKLVMQTTKELLVRLTPLNVISRASSSTAQWSPFQVTE